MASVSATMRAMRRKDLDMVITLTSCAAYFF
jgi:hypothetical protein